MSSQPSTTENLQNKASNAYESVANTITPSGGQDEDYDPNKDEQNFKKDIHGNTVKKGDLKDKLNEAAMGKQEPEEGYVEKVLSYLPGISKLQQSAFEQGEPEKGRAPPGPPNRPDNDVQVEQFLRKQYHSKSGDGMPDPGK